MAVGSQHAPVEGSFGKGAEQANLGLAAGLLHLGGGECFEAAGEHCLAHFAQGLCRNLGVLGLIPQCLALGDLGLDAQLAVEHALGSQLPRQTGLNRRLVDLMGLQEREPGALRVESGLKRIDGLGELGGLEWVGLKGFGLGESEAVGDDGVERGAQGFVVEGGGSGLHPTGSDEEHARFEVELAQSEHLAIDDGDGAIDDGAVGVVTAADRGQTQRNCQQPLAPAEAMVSLKNEHG